MAKVTYVGTPDDPQTQSITDGGITFVKGRVETVPDDHHWLDRYKNNPTFNVGKADPIAPTDDERDGLKVELDKRGVSYDPDASITSLRKTLADAMGTGPVEDGAADLSTQQGV